MIKVYADYKQVGRERKFQAIRATIGDKDFVVPIGFIRLSDMPHLEQMLKDAYELGKQPDKTGRCDLCSREFPAGELVTKCERKDCVPL